MPDDTIACPATFDPGDGLLPERCQIPVPDGQDTHMGPDHRSGSASWGDPDLPHPADV